MSSWCSECGLCRVVRCDQCKEVKPRVKIDVDEETVVCSDCCQDGAKLIIAQLELICSHISGQSGRTACEMCKECQSPKTTFCSHCGFNASDKCRYLQTANVTLAVCRNATCRHVLHSTVNGDTYLEGLNWLGDFQSSWKHTGDCPPCDCDNYIARWDDPDYDYDLPW